MIRMASERSSGGLQRGGLRDEKDMSGCAISGIMSEAGKRFSGEAIIRSIANMHDRSNGLGGGFAAYGIYPEHADRYAFHLMFDDPGAQEATRAYLDQTCVIAHQEAVPTRAIEAVSDRPLLHRCFVELKPHLRERYHDETEEDIVVSVVMHINQGIDGAFVMSSGKNMGVFKGVGYPEDIGRFFRLEE